VARDAKNLLASQKGIAKLEKKIGKLSVK